MNDDQPELLSLCELAAMVLVIPVGLYAIGLLAWAMN